MMNVLRELVLFRKTDMSMHLLDRGIPFFRNLRTGEPRIAITGEVDIQKARRKAVISKEPEDSDLKAELVVAVKPVSVRVDTQVCFDLIERS